MRAPLSRFSLYASAGALALLVWAGCGPAQEARPEPLPRVDACALLTAEDARTIAGEPLTPMSSLLDDSTSRPRLECVYSSDAASTKLVSLQIRHSPSRGRAASLFESTRASLHGPKGGPPSDVAGL
ncbi:MAG: hypothetical protein M3O15_07305, partial [Acidobacteriota bacterium]|nr:hypothetical protein [Acidobacteriota bacterium]